MSENKNESIDGFNEHLQHLGNIINYLDGLQMGEVGKFDKGEDQELKNNFIVLNDNQIQLEFLLKILLDLRDELLYIKNMGIEGPAGKDGKPGKDGLPGKDGKDGAPGRDLLFNNLSESEKASLRGADGRPGPAGRNGTDGAPGKDGKPFTYDMFTPQQLAALVGPAGANGKDGFNGTNGKDGKDGTNGTNGKDGTNGTNGTNGRDGIDGKSAYELAKEYNSNVGTILEWLASLKGADGKNGINGRDGINGKDGRNGVDGKDGINGKSLTWNDLPEAEKHNLKGENGAGVNVGGTKGQVLTKASDNDFDTYWQDLASTKKSYNGVIAPNAYKEIVTGIPARNIIIDIKVKDTAPNSETSGFYINAQNLSTVAITDNRIRIFNEYSTNLEFLITALVLNDSEIIAI
jgi:hypothetical protein